MNKHDDNIITLRNLVRWADDQEESWWLRTEEEGGVTMAQIMEVYHLVVKVADVDYIETAMDDFRAKGDFDTLDKLYAALSLEPHRTRWIRGFKAWVKFDDDIPFDAIERDGFAWAGDINENAGGERPTLADAEREYRDFINNNNNKPKD